MSIPPIAKEIWARTIKHRKGGGKQIRVGKYVSLVLPKWFLDPNFLTVPLWDSYKFVCVAE